MFINDMFFFHQRARRINIWAGFIILSTWKWLPYLTASFLIKYSICGSIFWASLYSIHYLNSKMEYRLLALLRYMYSRTDPCSAVCAGDILC